MQQLFINENKRFISKTNRLAYGAIEVVGLMKNPKINSFQEKAIYIHCFPPAEGTNQPLCDFTKKIHPADSHITRDTLKDFWLSTNEYQSNGDYKGGEWGSNNCPMLNPKWFGGVFIGDEIEVEYICNGTIPYATRCGSAFQPEDVQKVIEGTENETWSCNFHYNGQVYSGYLCNEIMGQKAIDVMALCVNIKLDIFCTIVVRGSPHPTVDMPTVSKSKPKIMPGGGEHKEPAKKGNCKKISVKAEAIRCLAEETGMNPDSFEKKYLVHIKDFKNEKRDPRYVKFHWTQDGVPVEFGIDRNSETELYAFIVFSYSEAVPKHMPHLDEIEVKSKSWQPIDSEELKDRSIWMIPEHALYLPLGKQKVLDLIVMSEEDIAKINLL